MALIGLLYSGVLFAEDLIHVVTRGETIFSISRFYSVSADELMRANGITDPSRLQAGRRLVIPVTEQSVLPASGPAISQVLTDYRVVRGDTLFSIARSHGITLQVLLDINKFAPNHSLRAGEVIKVPGTALVNTQPGNPIPEGSSQGSPQGGTVSSGIYSLRWPVTPKDIAYMTGQMGVVVEGERFESVKSLTQGNVVSAGPWRKFGRVVIVETAGGYYYMYGGLDTMSVSVGDRITPGIEIGKLGINSVSEKPQLFFMVFRSDIPIDPALAPRAVFMSSGASRNEAVFIGFNSRR